MTLSRTGIHPTRWLTTVLAAAAAWAALGTAPARAAERAVLEPLGPVPTVPVGSDAKDYLTIGSVPVNIPLAGPGELTGYARIALASDSSDPEDAVDTTPGSLTAAGLPGPPQVLKFSFEPSSSSVWGDDRPGVPSGGRKFTLAVPAGEHTLTLTGAAPEGAPVLVILYYEGPRQPHLPPESEAVASSKKKDKPLIAWSGLAAVDLIYNSNIMSASPDDNVDFIGGLFPWKFIYESKDDFILAPEFEIAGRADLLGWGQSRVRFNVKRWMYARNTIKTNTDFNFYLRQYFGKNQSLELFLHTSPEQYIKQLSDRPPYADPDAPLDWTQFRFQRNTWNLTWRQRISGSVNARLIYEENYRYYNQPFIENDISAQEVRGNVSWKQSKVLTWNVDYSFEDANARAVDQVGETPATSDDSDASYRRDLYRLGLDVRHRGLQSVLDRLSFSFLFMDYYYTTTKTLVQDPYHAGRRDMFYKASAEAYRDLNRNVTLKVGTRYTQRVVDSPWQGDLNTDKDFTQWLFWTSLEYDF